MDSGDRFPVKDAFDPAVGLGTGQAFLQGKLYAEGVKIVIAPGMINAETFEELRGRGSGHVAAVDDGIHAFSGDPLQDLLRAEDGVMGVGNNSSPQLSPSLFPSGSVNKPVLEEGPQGDEAIPGFDLFPLVIGTAVVADGDFLYLIAPFEEFGRQFRLQLEAAGVQRNFPDISHLEELIAGFHVGEAGMIKDIGQEGQQLVGREAAEIKVFRAFHKAGTVNHVRLTGIDHRIEFGVIVRIIFEVGILDNGVSGVCSPDPFPDGRALAPVLIAEDDLNAVLSLIFL